MRRFLCVMVLVVMSSMVTGCAGNYQYQTRMQSQQEVTEQDIMSRIPYPFSINVGHNKHYVINGKSDNVQSSWLKFAAALKPKPAEFSVWMSPKLVQEIQYNNSVRSLFADLGYTCKNEQIVSREYTPTAQQDKKRVKQKTIQLYQMDFVWTGEPQMAVSTEQSSRQGMTYPNQGQPYQGNMPQQQQSSFNWDRFWNIAIPVVLLGTGIAVYSFSR